MRRPRINKASMSEILVTGAIKLWLNTGYMVATYCLGCEWRWTVELAVCGVEQTSADCQAEKEHDVLIVPVDLADHRQQFWASATDHPHPQSQPSRSRSVGEEEPCPYPCLKLWPSNTHTLNELAERSERGELLEQGHINKREL